MILELLNVKVMQKIVYLNSYYLILKIKKIIQIICNNKKNLIIYAKDIFIFLCMNHWIFFVLKKYRLYLIINSNLGTMYLFISILIRLKYPEDVLLLHWTWLSLSTFSKNINSISSSKMVVYDNGKCWYANQSTSHPFGFERVDNRGSASALHPIHRLLPPTLLDLRVINVVACRWANDVEHVSDESECWSILYISPVISMEIIRVIFVLSTLY